MNGYGHGIAADGDRVLIGAVYANAAYLFDATTGEKLHVFHGDPDPGYFGHSVDIKGRRVLVGAHTGVGAAYLFTHNGSTWEKRRFDGTGPEDHFGCSVAFVGDKIAVGATLRR